MPMMEKVVELMEKVAELMEKVVELTRRVVKSWLRAMPKSIPPFPDLNTAPLTSNYHSIIYNYIR